MTRPRSRTRPAPVRRPLALALCVVLARSALAQPDAGAATAEDGAQVLARVEVVGSRIKRVDLETSQPVFVLERADIERTGLVALGDILQQVVTHGEGLNAKVNNGGDGGTRVNLRNLGANRTLVLVNGRRWVGELDGAVDLSSIPAAIVERIEILKDGASAIYGSDAIAGVINITTRKRYDGAEVRAHAGAFQQGDGQLRAYDLTLGRQLGKADLAFNLGFQEQDPVHAGDRAISAVPLYGLPANDVCAGASPTTPNGRFSLPGANNGPPIPCGGARPGFTVIEGRPGTSPADFRLFEAANESYNFAPANYLLTPQQRGSLFAQARYEFAPDLAFSSELLYNERRSSQLLAPGPLFISPEYAGALGNLGISAANLYNPFGVTLPRFARRFVESGGRRFEQDVDTWRWSAGLDGRFEVAGRSFDWDAHALRTRSAAEQRDAGVVDLQRVANGLGPSFLDAQGVPRCGVPGNVIDGCVPLNLFGGAGSITPEMIRYIAVEGRQLTSGSLTGYAANVGGDLWQLPAGPLGLATGYEYRRESGRFDPDPLYIRGQAGGGVVNFLPTRGQTSVGEAYLELNVPLLSDRPFAELLELNLAARHSDYSNFGSTTNGKAGFRWKPHADLLVRGNWSQGFRAPSVLELFEGTVSGGGGQFQDPCHPGTTPSAAVRANCAAAGVPAQFDLPDFTNTTTGGNAALLPETAVTRTLGLVYSPSWLTGLDLYLDWYRVALDQPIGALESQAIVNRCYVLGDPAACERITRNAAGQLFLVDATRQNVATGFESEGFDFTLDWRMQTRIGRWRVRADTAYVDYFGDRGRPARLTRSEDGTLLLGNTVGTRTRIDIFGAEWRIKSNVELGWSRGAWSASATGRYFSPLEETCQSILAYAQSRQQPQFRALCDDADRVVDLDGDGIGDPAGVRSVESAWYLDLQGAWETPWKARLALGVRNAAGRDPPVSYAAGANSFHPAYDIPGRYWYVDYTQRF